MRQEIDKLNKETTRFVFNWKITLFTVLFLPCLLSLSYWQLGRAEEKRQLLEDFNEKITQSPVAIHTLGSQLNNNADLSFYPVKVTGRFINDKSFLLDNKINHGKAGFEVITPFYDNQSQQVVLLNRGWLAMGKSRQQLPVIETIDGIQTVEGSVYVPMGKQIMLGDEALLQQWPQIIQTVDITELAMNINKPAFPYEVRLSEGSTGLYKRNWQVTSIKPEKHTAYAVQWFLMALALIILYGFSSYQKNEN